MFPIRKPLFVMCVAIALAAGCSRESPPAARPPADVTVLKIEPRNLPVAYEFIAQTQSPQHAQINCEKLRQIEWCNSK